MKYPIGIQSFEVLREDGFVYVDKTDLIYQLAQQHICFLCRPRRFGKSLTISTLEAYFKGKKNLFEGLKIMDLEKDWKSYPVFHIDFNGSQYSSPKDLLAVIEGNLQKWEEEYGRMPQEDAAPGYRFAYVLERAHEKTGNRCVALIDEYDKPMLDVLGEDAETQNRNILKGFYSVFKVADQHLRFVLLTGVTKFSQVSVFSGFNQPNDISMSPKFETLCGITEDELTTVFADSIHAFGQNLQLTDDEARRVLKAYYDGYHFSDDLTDVYNPFSLLNAFDKGVPRDYWFSTGTPTYLIRLLADRNVNMEELLSGEYEAAYFSDYRATTEDPLAMLYQSGYLTLKEVLPQEDSFPTYRLDYPNVEVKRGFVTMLCNNYFASKDEFGGVALKLVKCLKNKRLDDMRLLLDQYLSSIDYEMRKDKEYHFQYTIYLIFSLISSYHVKVEQHSSQGRADLIVETPKYVYIFEFKLDGSAEDALCQIEDRQYAKPYLLDSRPLTKIGVSFGRKSGTIDEWEIVEQV